MRKNAILIALCLFVFGSLQAQSQKGDIRLGLSVMPLLGNSSQFLGSYNGCVYKPSVMVNVLDRASLLMDLTFSRSGTLRFSYTGELGYSISYGLIPAFRYNLVNRSKLRVFTEAGVGLQTNSFRPYNTPNRYAEYLNYGTGFAITHAGVGVNYNINQRLGFELNMPFWFVRNITSSSPYNSFNGMVPSLGINLKIN